MTTSTTLSSRLSKFQSFKESIWGPGGQATARWMGVIPYPTFTPYLKGEKFDEDRGSLQSSFLSGVLVNGGTFSLGMVATYEDIEYILQGGLQLVAPSAGPPYIWTHIAPTTSTWATQSYTFEYGYSIGTLRALGCIIDSFGIKMEAKKEWSVSASGWYKSFETTSPIAITSSTNANPIEITTTALHGLIAGDQVVIADHVTNTAANGTWAIGFTSTTKFTLTGSTGNGVGGATGTITKVETPALADRTAEVIVTLGTTCKIDVSGGTLGTTAFTNQLISADLQVKNGLVPVWTADSKNPTQFSYDRVAVTLGLKLLMTAQVRALINSVLAAGTRVVVQLKQVSSAKSAEIDFAGILADDPAYYSAESGAQTVDLKFEGQYEATSIANDLKIIITNAIAAMP